MIFEIQLENSKILLFVTFMAFSKLETAKAKIRKLMEFILCMIVCYEILYSKTRRHSFSSGKFFFAIRVFCRLIDADLTIHWTKNGFFWRIKKWRWHLLVELSYLFFEKARIKGHPLLFWIIHDFNHSKLTKIRAESTKIDHVGRVDTVWRTLSRVF